MDKENVWTIPSALLIGAAAFGIAWAVMPKDKKDETPTAPVVAAADTTNVKGNIAVVAPPAPNEIAPPVKKDVPVPLAKPSSPGWLRSWTLPSEKLEGFDKNNFDVVDLTVNHDASRILTKSKAEVHLFDPKAGKILKTYKPAKPRWDYQKPDSQCMFLSPDTRFIGTVWESNAKTKTHDKFVTIEETETGRVVGTHQLDKDSSVYNYHDPATFTPAGEWLLLPGDLRREFAIQAASINGGGLRGVQLPNAGNLSSHVRLLLPVPNESTWIIYRDSGRTKDNPSGIVVLDLNSGKERALTSITIDPWCLFYERGVVLSPDGKLLLVQGIKQIQICDWRANKLVFDQPEGSVNYSQPHFTPDGKRFLVQRSVKFRVIRLGEPTPPKLTLRLYDIAGKNMIGEHEPEVQAAALRISGDGKTIVYAKETKLYAVDFKTVFNVEPLPPLAKGKSDVLPLK